MARSHWLMLEVSSGKISMHSLVDDGKSPLNNKNEVIFNLNTNLIRITIHT